MHSLTLQLMITLLPLHETCYKTMRLPLLAVRFKRTALTFLTVVEQISSQYNRSQFLNNQTKVFYASMIL